MIQVEEILIEEFRGIRHLHLQPGSKPFVIWGPNGSGKSGVVDAIDFALTGSIRRLSGRGTGAVSVGKHGPHVLQRDKPQASRVTLTFRDTKSGHRGVLTRCVKTSGTFTLSPDTSQLRAAVEQARQHPELTLSRREIIKYILAEPIDRAKAIQALLKLDRIDEVRSTLMTARNTASKAATAAAERLKNADAHLNRHLDLFGPLDVAAVTREVNQRRSALELPLLDEVAPDADLLSGMNTATGRPVFNKASAIRDVQALMDAIARPDQVSAAAAQLAAVLQELSADPGILSALRHQQLVIMGLEVIEDAACPLCDLHWDDIAVLRAHLQNKLRRFEAAADLSRRVLASATRLGAQLRLLAGLAQGAHRWAVSDGDPELPHRIAGWSADLIELAGKLQTIEGAEAQSPRVAMDVLAMPAGLVEGLAALQGVLTAKPDETAKDAARSFLTVAQERWAGVTLARTDHAKAVRTRTIAAEVYETYCAVADEALASLYKEVEADFSEYYRQINAGDESSFTAILEPSAGKLGFSVDFYGLGQFPPAAYHSEGHQDGMGVCLYLALAKQILAEDFRFAVLDDVVMSVDRQHRAQFCRLLKEAFPEVQFIITTHDEVWARQMQTSGLIAPKSQARFHGWTVSDGPAYEQGTDVWERIEKDLANDHAPAAAHKLRHHLEAVTSEIAASLRAQVTYKPDASYELGDFLAAVKKRHGELLRKAKNSAGSWNNTADLQRVEDLQANRAIVIPAQETESWVINKLVHNNDGAQMTSADFRPVLDASRRFLELFQCGNPDCGSWIRVVGDRGKEESLRCSCGAYNLNLLAR